MATPDRQVAPDSEAALAERWRRGLRGPLRLADGRALHIIFPGVPGGGSGPDFRDAIIEVEGSLLRGDVEVHLHTSGWREHGHAGDPTYTEVILHVVAAATPAPETLHASGRHIPILVVPPEPAVMPPPWEPPCRFASAAGYDVGAVLDRLAHRRLRQKAGRLEPLIARHGVGQALYEALLEIMGGPANRRLLVTIATSLPLSALLERASDAPDRTLALAAHLKGAALDLPLKRAGMRPAARPERRLDTLARLIHRLWPDAASAGWPPCIEALAPDASATALVKLLRVEGMGRGLAIECWTNALLPTGVASGNMEEGQALGWLSRLPSPGTYGLLRPLEGWVGGKTLRDGRTAPGRPAAAPGLLFARPLRALSAQFLSSGMTSDLRRSGPYLIQYKGKRESYSHPFLIDSSV